MPIYVTSLDWDDWNINHLEVDKGLTVEDVEEVVFGPNYSRRHGERTYVTGKTHGGHFLTIVLQPLLRGLWRLKTGWKSDRNEINTAKKHVVQLRS